MSESHAADHAHHEMGFLHKYIFSTDHKIIGIQYLITAMAMAASVIYRSRTTGKLSPKSRRSGQEGVCRFPVSWGTRVRR